MKNTHDFLSVVLGVRISSYSQAQYIYGVLRSAGVSRALRFEVAPTLTQTLCNVREAICAHYAKLCEIGRSGLAKGYELHLRLLGENALFFDTQGNELGDDINPLPYRNFSFETLFGGADSFLEPNLPPNAKRKYIPRDDDYRKWRSSGVKMGVISVAPKDDKPLRTILKANDKIGYVLVNGRVSDKSEVSCLIYALCNAMNLREFLCELGERFAQKTILYSANGADFERVYMSGIFRNEMLFSANLWDKNGNFSAKDYERLRAHFCDNDETYKVAQFADRFGGR